MNKGVAESRTLASRDTAAEDIGFPFAAQVALVARQHTGREIETVGLITDKTVEELPAERWIASNRLAWGIENGTHQRLDVSLNEDRCRVRNPKALLVLGMIRRLVISLFMEWRAKQTKPQHQSMTDFQAAMGEDNMRKAMSFVTSQRPKL